MGSPTPQTAADVPLNRPSFSEKMRGVLRGLEIGSAFHLGRLEQVLEEMRIILLPLTRHLEETLPIRTDRKRAMRIFGKGFGHVMSLALDRAGIWHFHAHAVGQTEFVRVTSEELARDLIIDMPRLLRMSLTGFGSLDMIDFMNDTPDMRDLKNVAYHHAVLWFVEECGKSVDKTLSDKEQEIALMRERLRFLTDYATSLDPLILTEKEVKIPHHAIVDEGLSSNRKTPDYLCSSALQVYWDRFRSRNTETAKKYCEAASLRPIDSMGRFFFILGQHVQQIAESRRRGETTLEAFTRESARLPFSSEELDVVRHIAREIASQPT